MLNCLFRPHRAYLLAGTEQEQTLYAMLRVIPRAEVGRLRAPIAVTLVMDTSGSMRGYVDQKKARALARGKGRLPEKDDLKAIQGLHLPLETKGEQSVEAAHSLIDDARLLPEDRLAVIGFDDQPRTLLPLAPLGDRSQAHAAVEALHDCRGGTCLARGMRNALQEFEALPAHVAKRVVLLTDGQTADEADCSRLAHRFAEQNTPLVTIGIGEKYNEFLLRDLAEISQGRPYHIPDLELKEIFDEEIGVSVREVFTDLQATVRLVRGVKLASITRVYRSLAEVDLAQKPYRLGNVIAQDYTVFILEFTVGGLERPPSRVQLAQVVLEGHAPGLDRREEFPLQLAVEFTDDEPATAAVDPEVMNYVQQRNVDRLLHEALRLGPDQRHRVHDLLRAAAELASASGNAAVARMVQEAIQELQMTHELSAQRRKTILLGFRTRTIRPDRSGALEGVPPEILKELIGA
jgi:Ca-activated chloride channel family protein